MGQTDSSGTEIVRSAEARPLSKIAARALHKVRKSARPDQGQDLPEKEPGTPTERAAVYTDDEEFEKRLEKLLEKRLELLEKQREAVSFEVKVPFVAIRTGIKTPDRSPMSRAATAFLLILAGCMCIAVLHAIGAPQWAQLIGLLLPWVIAVSQTPLRRGPGTGGRVA
jgi:hypothetical protein